jgi:hypothetical protein
MSCRDPKPGGVDRRPKFGRNFWQRRVFGLNAGSALSVLYVTVGQLERSVQIAKDLRVLRYRSTRVEFVDDGAGGVITREVSVPESDVVVGDERSICEVGRRQAPNPLCCGLELSQHVCPTLLLEFLGSLGDRDVKAGHVLSEK